MSPKQRPFDHHLSQDDDYDKPDQLGGRKVGYDSKTEEKVVIDDPDQSAATSGPTREESEAWLKTKGLSKDEVDLIVIYVFDFGRETKPSIRAVADAFACKKRQWVDQTLKQPAVRECCLIVKFCHNTGKPLPPAGPASALPQPKEIDEYVTRIVGKPIVSSMDASDILEAAANSAGRLAMRLQISHYPDNHPQRHSGNNSLIGCAASAKEMLVPGGFHQNLVAALERRSFSTDDSDISYMDACVFSEAEFPGRLITTRGLIEAITARGITVPEAATEIEQLNKLLTGDSLYKHFKDVVLPKEAKKLAAWIAKRNHPAFADLKSETCLRLDETPTNSALVTTALTRLNRLILEAAFPDQCPKNLYLPLLNRILRAEDIVPIIRRNPSCLLRIEGRLILEALVDLLEDAFFGDSGARVPGIAVTGCPRKTAVGWAQYYLGGLLKPQRGSAYNYHNDSLTQILEGFVLRVQDLQTEWKIVRQRPENVTKKGLLEKFRDAHGRELQGYSSKRLKIILTDNPRVVAAGLASDATGLDESVFRRAQEKGARQPGGPTGFRSPYSL